LDIEKSKKLGLVSSSRLTLFSKNGFKEELFLILASLNIRNNSSLARFFFTEAIHLGMK